MCLYHISSGLLAVKSSALGHLINHASGLSNLVTTKESASFQNTANSPSRQQTLEEAYWTSKQKHAGIRRFNATPKDTDDPKNQVRCH